jgi:hypothetical protein
MTRERLRLGVLSALLHDGNGASDPLDSYVPSAAAISNSDETPARVRMTKRGKFILFHSMF